MRGIAGSILVGCAVVAGCMVTRGWVATDAEPLSSAALPGSMDAVSSLPGAEVGDAAGARTLEFEQAEAQREATRRARAMRPRHFEADGQSYVWIHGADFTDDGALDILDIAAFRQAWAVGDRRSDYNHDGRIDAADLAEFLQAFAHGEWRALGIC